MANAMSASITKTVMITGILTPYGIGTVIVEALSLASLVQEIFVVAVRSMLQPGATVEAVQPESSSRNRSFIMLH